MGLITPQQAVQASRLADPWQKNGGRIPRKPSDPPGTGSFMRFLHEVNYVLDLFFDQCTVDPYIYAETGAIAAFDAFYSIFDPDPKELYHELIGQSLVCSLKQEIRDARRIENKFWDGARKVLFKTAELADLAVWRLFLASVFADGLVEWQTMAQKMAGCNGSKSPFSSSVAQGAMPDAKFQYEANGLEWLTGDPLHPAFTPNWISTPTQSGHCFWVCEAKAIDGSPVPLEYVILDLETFAIVQHGTSNPKGADDWHPVIASYRGHSQGASAQHLGLRAWCPVELPDNECFFKSGFCAIKSATSD